ncbi:MAG: TAXI family TRAP transporter solute-binding subunit [Betaproteobacteria bacterium]
MRAFAAALLTAIATCVVAPVQAASGFKIVTASERGTYIKIGQDLAQYVAPRANLRLDVLPSAGSAENVRRLRYEPGVKLALVQSDVYQAFLDQAAAGNADAANLIRPLRVVMPLYNEEIYFVVRADSPLNTVDDIRGLRINAGLVGSGTALTTTTLYKLMFNEPLADANASFMSNEEALAKLVTDRSVDVVAIIAGQPAKVLADMKPESRKYVKLLRFDPNHASSEAVLRTYFTATVRAASYPNLLTEDLPALAVKAYLVTYEFDLGNTRAALRRFARAMCDTFDVLQANGHPKWREVELALPDLGQGWSYYAPTAREFKACIASSARRRPAATADAPAVPRARAVCSQQERVLGLCR